jgi:hypothetical protein
VQVLGEKPKPKYTFARPVAWQQLGPIFVRAIKKQRELPGYHLSSFVERY